VIEVARGPALDFDSGAYEYRPHRHTKHLVAGFRTHSASALFTIASPVQATGPRHETSTADAAFGTAGPHTKNKGKEDNMPQLARSEWYDLTRDMNWTLRYVEEDQVWPQIQSNSYGVPAEKWWIWDEPYKITYPEYVHNQVDKDVSVYAVNSILARSAMYESLDPGWKSAILAHYGAIAVPEYLAGLGEARMGRFGRCAAWRNMATYGTLDETRHGQIQTFVPHGLLAKEPRAVWAH
jgi:toluene monooxygenase system protein A